VLELAALVFAAESPERLSEFWAQALGYELDGTRAVDPAGEVPPLVFRGRSKSPTIETPIHLDVNTPDPDAEIGRLLELGARIVVRKTVSYVEFSESWTVMRDPERNGFCVQGPDTRRDSSYLGNVTFSCAEPVALARFWREALGYGETEFPDELWQKLLAAGIDPAEREENVDAVHPDGRRPRLLFQRRQKSAAPEPPILLELRADDVETEAARLVSLGATRAGGGDDGLVLLDPDGNRFLVGA
jgi:hypothetical protein